TETLGQPATAKQKQEYHSFQFSGVLVHSQNLEDFTDGAESVLAKRNYHLLPGETSVMRTFYNGSDFVVVVEIGQVTSLVYIPSLHWYQIFMKEYGSCVSAWLLIGPFPVATKPDPSNYWTVKRKWF